MHPAPEILDYLANGGLVVAANPRASRVLRRAYANSQLAKSINAWHSPGVTDWSSFLSGFWQQRVFTVPNPPILLSPLQESWLWQRILKAQPETKSVAEIEPLAKLAERAYLLLSDYCSHSQLQHPWSIRSEESLSDPEAFRRWAVAFDRECSKLNAVSRSQLASIIAKDIRNNAVTIPSEIRLLGFDRYTPAQSTVLDALKNAGCILSTPDIRVESTESRVVLAKNREDEIATCASWLRQFVASNPDKRVAVIAPNVQPIRGHMERVFRRALLPDSMQIAHPPASLPFEFSLGIALATVPIVRAALLLLALDSFFSACRRGFLASAFRIHRARRIRYPRSRRDRFFRAQLRSHAAGNQPHQLSLREGRFSPAAHRKLFATVSSACRSWRFRKI